MGTLASRRLAGLAPITIAAFVALTLLLIAAQPAHAQLQASAPPFRATHLTDRAPPPNPTNIAARNLQVAVGGGRYLMVWLETGTFQPDEIWGRFVDSGGNLIGDEVNISECGGACTDIGTPSVAYDSIHNQFLVAWYQRSAGHYEIFGRRVGEGSNGATPLATSFQISHAADANSDASAMDPAVAFSPDAANNNGEFLVVWEDTRIQSNGNGSEIFGQRVGPSSTLDGPNFRVSEAEAKRAGAAAEWPAVAYNHFTKTYLVAWYDDRWNVATNSDGTLSEPSAQRLNPNGTDSGGGDFRLDSEAIGDTSGQKVDPAGRVGVRPRSLDVGADPTNGYDIVVFEAGGFTSKKEGHDQGGVMPSIYGYYVAPDDKRTPMVISDLQRMPLCGGDGQGCFLADVFSPRVTRDTKANEWLVTWDTDGLENHPDDASYNTGRLKHEIVGQRLGNKLTPDPPCPGNYQSLCDHGSYTYEVGDDFPVTNVFSVGRGRQARDSDVAYDAGADRFMVFYAADALQQPYQNHGYTFYNTDDWVEGWGQMLTGAAASADDKVQVGATGGGRPPHITGLKVTPRKFRTTGPKHKKGAPPRGATISYTDDAPATTKLAVFKRVPGIVKNGKCVARPKHVTGHPKKCTRAVHVGGFTHGDTAGHNKIRFRGVVNGKKLRPGKYLLTATPTNRGVTGAPATASFRVVSP